METIIGLTTLGFSHWATHYGQAPSCVKGSPAQAMEITSLSQTEFEAFYERSTK